MTKRPPNSLTLGQAAALAILCEVTAPKPGNVHRGADFEDMRYDDLVSGGIAIVPAIERAAEDCVGQIILNAVSCTRQLVGTNTNLGTVLLFAPLAKAATLIQERGFQPEASSWRSTLNEVLKQLDEQDAELTYAAIRLARPGGLGEVEQHDVRESAPESLLVGMRAAAERDLVAAQFANGFEQVFDFVLPRLQDGAGSLSQAHHVSRNETIVRVFLELLARHPDSLIARKCGVETAQQASDRAAHVLQAGQSDENAYLQALADFDFWLRSDGHRRNPGTTADLMAAGLFCLIWLKAIANEGHTP